MLGRSQVAATPRTAPDPAHYRRIVQTGVVSSYGTLRVGSLVVGRPRNRVDVELLTVFRDDMLVVTPITAGEYYTEARGYVVDNEADVVDREMELVEYRAPSHIIAARLDLLGINEESVLDYLQQKIADEKAIESSRITEDLRGHFQVEVPPEYREKLDRASALWKSLDARG
jgi:hypothetical protein